MESPSKKDKDSMIDIKTETPETAGTKAKPGFWSRLKNYTAEPPKTVVIENGVEKLVLIPPKITITPKTVLPKEETIKGKPAEKPISVSQSAVLEEIIEGTESEFSEIKDFKYFFKSDDEKKFVFQMGKLLKEEEMKDVEGEETKKGENKKKKKQKKEKQMKK